MPSPARLPPHERSHVRAPVSGLTPEVLSPDSLLTRTNTVSVSRVYYGRVPPAVCAGLLGCRLAKCFEFCVTDRETRILLRSRTASRWGKRGAGP